LKKDYYLIIYVLGISTLKRGRTHDFYPIDLIPKEIYCVDISPDVILFIDNKKLFR